MKTHTISLKGKRDYNEDRFDTLSDEKEHYYAIYDGHGGDAVSDILKNNFLSKITKIYNKNEIISIFKKFQKELRENNYNDALECGSTVLVTRINELEKTIQIMSLGDSRSILCYGNKVIQLNPEHKPDSEDEKKRITLEGYKIKYDKIDEIFRVQGYAVSRSMGDLKYPVISQKPFIQTLRYSSNTKFVLLASDGLWDVLSNEDVKSFVLEKLEKQGRLQSQDKTTEDNIAYSLGKYAIKQGSMDNVSIVLVFLC